MTDISESIQMAISVDTKDNECAKRGKAGIKPNQDLFCF